MWIFVKFKTKSCWALASVLLKSDILTSLAIICWHAVHIDDLFKAFPCRCVGIWKLFFFLTLINPFCSYNVTHLWMYLFCLKYWMASLSLHTSMCVKCSWLFHEPWVLTDARRVILFLSCCCCFNVNTGRKMGAQRTSDPISARGNRYTGCSGCQGSFSIKCNYKGRYDKKRGGGVNLDELVSMRVIKLRIWRVNKSAVSRGMCPWCFYVCV